MELWDIYNAERKPIGKQAERTGKLEKGEYHIVVGIWVIDDDGNFLLTYRDPAKPNYPSTWENPGGALLAGETSVQGAVRELREETGIEARPEDMVHIDTARERNSFVDTYVLRKNVRAEDIRLQPGETADARMVSYAELEALARLGVFAPPIERRFFQLRGHLMDFLDSVDMGGVAVRYAVAADASALAAIQREAMDYAIGEEVLQERLERVLEEGQDGIFVALDEGRPVGYIHATDYNCLYLPPMKNVLVLAVLPDFRCRGMGGALLERAENWARAHGACGIWVEAGTHCKKAREFYKHRGYMLREQHDNFKKILPDFG